MRESARPHRRRRSRALGREAVGECGVGRNRGHRWGEKMAADGEKTWPPTTAGGLSGGADGPVAVELQQVVGRGD
jgi:hypothetical protein